MPWSNTKNFRGQDAPTERNLPNATTNKFSAYARTFQDKEKGNSKKQLIGFREYVKQAAAEEQDGYGEGDEILPDTFFELANDVKELIKKNVKDKVKEMRKLASSRKERKEEQKSKKPAGVQPGGAVNATVPQPGETPPPPTNQPQ